MAAAALVVLGATAEVDPLAGVVLSDSSGRSWHLDELHGVPVLLLIADRQGFEQATDWGQRLAARAEALAPWRAADKVAWLVIVDLLRVPDFARDAARARVRELEADRTAGERGQGSPLLLDWGGALSARFGAARAEALLALLSADHRVLVQARGAPTDEAVASLLEAIAGAAPHPTP
jgi:hypothetical protein